MKKNIEFIYYFLISDTVVRTYPLKIHSWGLFIILIIPTVYTLYHLINYSATLGIGETALGMPKNYEAVIFDFSVCFFALISAFGLTKKNKYSWSYLISFLSFIAIASALKEISLIDRYIGYFNFPLFLVFLSSLWLIVFYLNKRIRNLLFRDKGIPTNIWISSILGFIALFGLWLFVN